MFFFFKQKTAYDMRISDWSSDVCSSDLCALPQACTQRDHRRGDPRAPWGNTDQSLLIVIPAAFNRCSPGRAVAGMLPPMGAGAHWFVVHCCGQRWRGIALGRSDEHPSELQSLMRISYAVFCLKKNNPKQHIADINAIANHPR